MGFGSVLRGFMVLGSSFQSCLWGFFGLYIYRLEKDFVGIPELRVKRVASLEV